jgi:hypothetical protein
MIKSETLLDLCCEVLDIPNWAGSTEEYIQQVYGKSIEDLTEKEAQELIQKLKEAKKQK